MALVSLGVDGAGTGDKLLLGSRFFCKTTELVAAVTSFVEVLRDLRSKYITLTTFILNNKIIIIIEDINIYDLDG